jgi:hypothetical protein
VNAAILRPRPTIEFITISMRIFSFSAGAVSPASPGSTAKLELPA